LGTVYFFLQHCFNSAKQGQACCSFFFRGGFTIIFNLSLPPQQPASEELGARKRHTMATKARILRMAWYLEKSDTGKLEQCRCIRPSNVEKSSSVKDLDIFGPGGNFGIEESQALPRSSCLFWLSLGQGIRCVGVGRAHERLANPEKIALTMFSRNTPLIAAQGSYRQKSSSDPSLPFPSKQRY
jgi:hypothetical protein